MTTQEHCLLDDCCANFGLEVGTQDDGKPNSGRLLLNMMENLREQLLVFAVVCLNSHVLKIPALVKIFRANRIGI